jgi:hypothetical protein
MATLHKCDGCGERYRDKDELTVVHIKRGEKFEMARRAASVELCDDCYPNELVEHLVGRMNIWPDVELAKRLSE